MKEENVPGINGTYNLISKMVNLSTTISKYKIAYKYNKSNTTL